MERIYYWCKPTENQICVDTQKLKPAINLDCYPQKILQFLYLQKMVPPRFVVAFDNSNLRRTVFLLFFSSFLPFFLFLLLLFGLMFLLLNTHFILGKNNNTPYFLTCKWRFKIFGSSFVLIRVLVSPFGNFDGIYNSGFDSRCVMNSLRTCWNMRVTCFGSLDNSRFWFWMCYEQSQDWLEI